MSVFKLASTMEEKIRAAGAADELYAGMVERVLAGAKDISKDLTLEDGLLFRKGCWVVPDSRELKNMILKAEHDSRVAGHFGQFKTLERVKANFFWPKMDLEVEEYVRSCDSCQRNKATQHKKYGLLDPLDIPNRPWEDISMDFIVGLPESAGYTKIWVIVDRFSKMAHFIPLTTEVPIERLALMFLKEIWRYHGLPESIISDRDSRFTSKFWTSLMKLLGVKLNVSTAFHPETDGQTERVNQTLEQYIRSYCSCQQ